MNFHSVEEILRFAMARENLARQFYLELSKAVTNPGTQAIFEALAHAEQHQQEALKLELFKIGSTVSAVEGEPGQPAQPPFQINHKTREMSALEALELAMKNQRTAFRMFAELMAHTDNPDASEILYGLAEQEMRHLIELEREYKSLHPREDKP